MTRRDIEKEIDSKLAKTQGNYPAYDPNSLEPTRPLDIRDGVIHYQLYNQAGELVPATCKDSVSNRYFVVWVRKFDRN